MDQINSMELTDPDVYPDDKVLNRLPGNTFATYRDLLLLFKKHDLEHEWRYYRDGKAWLCKVRKGKKTVLWMSAWDGFMKLIIYLPEKYVDELWKLTISEETKERFRNTRGVGKSKPCMFELKNGDLLNELEEVIQFKIRMK